MIKAFNPGCRSEFSPYTNKMDVRRGFASDSATCSFGRDKNRSRMPSWRQRARQRSSPGCRPAGGSRCPRPRRAFQGWNLVARMRVSLYGGWLWGTLIRKRGQAALVHWVWVRAPKYPSRRADRYTHLHLSHPVCATHKSGRSGGPPRRGYQQKRQRFRTRFDHRKHHTLTDPIHRASPAHKRLPVRSLTQCRQGQTAAPEAPRSGGRQRWAPPLGLLQARIVKGDAQLLGATQYREAKASVDLRSRPYHSRLRLRTAQRPSCRLLHRGPSAHQRGASP